MYDTKQLAKVRYDLLIKGWCTNKDIQLFWPCGYTRARKIMQEIQKEVELEGKTNLDGGVHVVRLIKKLQATEAKIRRDYEESRIS